MITGSEKVEDDTAAIITITRIKIAYMAIPIHPMMIPALAMDSPVCQPPLAAISFFAWYARMSAMIEHTIGHDTSPKMARTREATALPLLLTVTTGPYG